ncbi:MAG TPA: hypothetical protein VGL22_19635 [Terracidiphilus sp.]
MHRPILTCVFLVFSAAALAQQQQQPSPSDPYQGQSTPPADDVILATQPDQPTPPKAKPHAGKPLSDAQAAPRPAPPPPSDAPPAEPNVPAADTATRPSSSDASANVPNEDANGSDDGLVGVAKPVDPSSIAPASGDPGPGLRARSAAADPDGDIVQPNPLQPGQLAYGATIRVKLLTRLSTVDSRQGEIFRTTVASDVLQDGQVLIPAGAEIDGRVVQVSSGSVRSHGTILLRPETVILPDGSRHQLDAQISGTPGSRTRVDGEGFINPGSRVKKDTLLYGGAMGVGAATGALVGGPVGAIAGTAIGAGAITVHIVTSHSEATLEPGTVLLLTLDNRLDLQAASQTNPTGN